ncbi:MAG: cytochrome bc complex cytochrome b subunit [Chloroflexi bacterium]|nr:cytochrome bc complex cytochrome b subunit [Chloroflexota bacterium]
MAVGTTSHLAQKQEGRWARFWKALDERLGLSSLSYPVPRHANTISYTLGGITLVSFIILVATGVLLAQFYHPHPSEANGSVRYIMAQVSYGDIIRSIHYWAASAMFLTAVLHLLRVFFTGAYRRPREANWLVGVGLLALTFGAVFTGTVLKWDQEAYEALQHNTEMAEILGLLGFWFSPEFAATTPLLERINSAHISILPLLIGALLLAHFFLVKYHGISPLPWGRKEQARPATASGARAEEAPTRFAQHLRHLTAYGLVLVAVLLALSALFPAPIGPEPMPGIEVTKPPWMFLWLYAFENVFGIKGIIYASAALFVLLIAVPFVDRASVPALPARRPLVAAGLAVLALAVALSIYVWQAPTALHLGMGG